MSTNTIDFDLIGIGKELMSTLLSVPIYQRSYAWDCEAILEYWSDLESALAESASQYFLGTVVLTKEGAGSRDTIIDGQQRLATTAILFSAIRDVYQLRGETKHAQAIQEKFLSDFNLETGENQSRLRLNSDDDFFFFKKIVCSEHPEPSRDSHKLISETYDFFFGKFQTLAEKAGRDLGPALYKWVEFVRDQVRIMRLRVPSEADAFLIFETLNDRGVDLTIADLLKNYLFGHAGSRLDAVRDAWMLVLGTLEITAENKLFTTFLRHYWTSVHGPTRERDLYKSIKEHVVTEAQVIEFMNDLQGAAILYSALLSSSHEYWDGFGTTVRKNLETLLRLDLEQNRPLLLSVLQHFTDPEQKKLLRALVSWSVRGLIVGGIGGGTSEKVWGSASVKIRKGEIKTVEELLQEVSQIVPSDERFRTAFAIARVPKGAIARYYLLALEKQNIGREEPELVPNENEEEVNLEHVLPRRATEEDWGRFTADERKDFLHRVGNLALLQKGPNGRIGNKPFSIKKPILAASDLALTKEIGGGNEWTPADIQQRQERLARLAAATWPRK